MDIKQYGKFEIYETESGIEISESDTRYQKLKKVAAEQAARTLKEIAESVFKEARGSRGN